MRVVLTGCAVRERDRAGLARKFPAVDLFLRPDEEPELVERLGLASAQGPVGLGPATAATTLVKGSRSRRPTTSPGRARRPSSTAPLRRESAVAAWLPIIYGCDKTCTYCIVPFSRGPERSRPFDEVVDEARRAGRGRLPRGHAPRPERQQLRPRPAAEARFAPCRRGAPGRAPARPERPARPGGADPGDRRDPGRGRAARRSRACASSPPTRGTSRTG